MRRLLSLALMAGLATPSGALADSSRSQTSAPGSPDRVERKSDASAPSALATDGRKPPQLPSFLRQLLEKAGVVEPEPRPLPWFAWWFEMLGIDPDALPSRTTASTAPPSPATTTTTASR